MKKKIKSLNHELNDKSFWIIKEERLNKGYIEIIDNYSFYDEMGFDNRLLSIYLNEKIEQLEKASTIKEIDLMLKPIEFDRENGELKKNPYALPIEELFQLSLASLNNKLKPNALIRLQTLISEVGEKIGDNKMLRMCKGDIL